MSSGAGPMATPGGATTFHSPSTSSLAAPPQVVSISSRAKRAGDRGRQHEGLLDGLRLELARERRLPGRAVIGEQQLEVARDAPEGAAAGQRVQHGARDRHRIVARQVDGEGHGQRPDAQVERAAGVGQVVVERGLGRGVEGWARRAAPSASDAASSPPTSASGTAQTGPGDTGSASRSGMTWAIAVACLPVASRARTVMVTGTSADASGWTLHGDGTVDRRTRGDIHAGLRELRRTTSRRW